MIEIVNARQEGLDAKEASYAALSRLGWKPKLRSVFIKPNVGAASKWVNTHPDVVEGIIHYLHDLKIEDITVGEGSVETEYESSFYNFRHAGWTKFADRNNVKLVDLNQAERIKVSWRYGYLPIPKVLFHKSYINVAKIKTHMQTLVSFCAKNQKGLLDGETRKMFHRLGLHRPIAELAKTIKPELCVVDGIVAVEGNGPGEFGRKRELGVVVAGSNLIEVDRVCCRIIGVVPDKVDHIRFLSRGFKENCNRHFKAFPVFQLPSKEFKMFRVHVRPENACSACQSSLGKMNKLVRKSLRGIWFFLKRGFLTRLDIIIGSPRNLPENHGYCIFYGDCAKKISRRHPEFPWVRGCPPISKRALEELT